MYVLIVFGLTVWADTKSGVLEEATILDTNQVGQTVLIFVLRWYADLVEEYLASEVS